MRTNLIQSYLNDTNAQQYNSDKVVKDFDVHRELTNRTFIKPLPSNGKLVRPSLFDMPSIMWKDMKYDYRAFKHAVKGEANDHELGRLNDFGMKFGGVAIAAYLFARRQTPTRKLFEFIGLATFFGAMDVWPKLFLQLPAYLVHGINIRQQYEDNYGRKKMFYQDHQFIPWDLYSDKEINKIGDRMRVPKDIPNRRDYIQEKMRKIALQNNTMWMLTAGFATPILSALMCNALEKPVLRYVDNKMNIKADNLMKDFNEEIKKYDSSANVKELEELLKENNGKPISPELFDKIVENISDDIDPVTSSSIRRDLEIMLKPDKAHVLSDEALAKLHSAVSEHFAKIGLTQEELSNIIPNIDTLKQELTNKSLMNSDMEEFSEPTKVLQNLLEANINKFLGDDTSSVRARRINLQFRTMGSALEHGKDTALQGAFKTQSAAVITEDIAKSLKEISGILNTVKAKCRVFDEFAYIKVAQAQETVLANSWNEMSESLMKALHFTPEEIRIAKFDRELSSSVLRNKLETLAADKEGFGKFVEEFGRVYADFEGKMDALLNTDAEQGNLYHRNVISTFNESSDKLKGKSMFRTAASLAGHDDLGETSLKHIYMSFVTDRVKSVKYSFYRLFDTAAFYYRIAQGYKLDDILPNTMYRETKEEAVELAKVTLLEGHTSDTAVKLFQNRYVAPDKSDLSQIEVEAGKVKNKYFGTRELKDLVEHSNDNEYFERVMKLMFGGEIHPDIVEKIKNPSLLEDFMRYREDALKYIGGDKYFAKLYHLVDGQEHASSSLFKFILMGCAPDEMFNKLFNNTYNSKKWFSMVGKLGAGLIGVTLVSQFFFGRTKDPKKFREAKS